MKVKRKAKAILVPLLVGLIPLVGLPSEYSDTNNANFSSAISGAKLNISEIHGDLESLRAKLSEAEGSLNAFEPSIAELSIAIADQLVENGEFMDALVSYRRALHITRANTGLESDQQTFILGRIFLTYIHLGDTAAAANTLRRVTAIYMLTQTANSPEFVKHLRYRGGWHLATYEKALVRPDLQHLIEAHNAFDSLRRLNIRTGVDYDPEIYRSLSITNHAMAVHVKHQLLFGKISQQTYRAGENSALIDFSINSYRRGRNQLREGVRHAERSGQPEDLIEATIQLADWEQLFSKRYTAKKLYLKAYDHISTLPEDHALRAVFTQPQILPTHTTDSVLTDFYAPKESIEVAVVFDLSHWGRSRNVRLSASDQADIQTPLHAKRSAIRRAERSLFRPVIIGGKTVGQKAVPHTLYEPI